MTDENVSVESPDDSVTDEQTTPLQEALESKLAEASDTPEYATEEVEKETSSENVETLDSGVVVSQEASFDPYSVQEVGTDPTHSAQEGDESGLEMDELVTQVFAGKWGNGQERRQRLAAAGYDHVAVQDAVVARMNEKREK